MSDAQTLPRDPHEGLTLENDIVGARIWGPPERPAALVGRSDVWDRRWFADRQPLVTLARIRELAMADRITEIARNPNRTVYHLYNRYDFPCPKPGAQLVFVAPFAREATVERADGGVRVALRGDGKRLDALFRVPVSRSLLIVECAADGLAPADLALRAWRHRDTILPGEPLDPTLGDERSATDFDPILPPLPLGTGEGVFGVILDFPPDPTFPDGFRVVLAARVVGARVAGIESATDEIGLGAPYWAEKEGRLDHGLVKRYSPINASPGAAETASLDAIPSTFVVLAAIATSTDDRDPVRHAVDRLDEAVRLGIDGLHGEDSVARVRGRRSDRAVARIAGKPPLEAPELVLPRLRTSDGYWGDVPLCSVGPTRTCFQDAGLWHADFHLNEIRAEYHVTLGRFAEILPYAEMVRTLLEGAMENARDVYGLPGAMYPLVHFPLRTRGVAHTNLTWEQDLGLNGLVAKPLWLLWRYGGESLPGGPAYLREIAWPVLRECARFCRAYLSEESDGRLHVVPSVSPEHWGLTARFERNRDCTSAITLTRYLFRAATAAARELGPDAGIDPAESADWTSAAARIVDFPTYATENGPIWTDVLGAPPIEYNIPVPLSPIFWGDEVGLDSPPNILAIARRTLEKIDVWEPHRPYLNSCVRSRLGIHEPGAPVGPENLLLSYQSIRIFPAAPAEGEIVMEEFAAEGGFRVSARRTASGETRDVRIRSTRGGECALASPWSGRAVTVKSDRGDTVALAATDILRFSTTPGGSYFIRPG